jgi:ABC-2 type transport system ATP-binding protein
MMALIHNPDVVFLDEPTLGLDPQVRHAMWEYIESLKGKKTILLTTHYMEEADHLADRIGIMDQGRIVALGTPVELKQSLIKEPTMRVQAFNISQRMVADLKNFYPKVEFSGGTLSISAEHLEFNEIVNRLQNAGATIRSAQIKDPSLEDVYLKLTGKELRE